MSKNLLFIILCSFAISAAAQRGSVSGKVISKSGEPVSFVAVILKNTKIGNTTDENGTFSISAKQGNYTLKIEGIGYNSIEKYIEIVNNQSIQLPDITLEENNKLLNEVVVSAEKSDKYVVDKPSESLRVKAALREIPQSINIATKQTIRDMGMLSKGEIARISSGVTKSYGGNLDMTLQIRGTNATYGTYRNGVGGPIWWNAQEDASMIEKIEFVKGPAGFMLANSEPGGMVNTVTKQAMHDRTAEIGFGLGSYNLMRTNIDLGGELSKNGKLTYRLNLGGQQNNEFYNFGAFNRKFIAPVLKYEFNENTSITFEHNYVKAQAQENTHSSISINGNLWALPIIMAINDPNQDKFWGEDIYNRVHLTHKIAPKWTLNAQAAQMTTNWDGTTLYLAGISATKDSIYRANSMSDWWGKLTNMQLFVDGKFNTGSKMEHNILAGLDYGEGSEGSRYAGTWGENQKYALLVKEPTYYLPKDSLKIKNEVYSWLSTNRWMAFYFQDHLKLFDKLILTLAGRFTVLTTGQDWNSPPDDLAYEVTDKKFTPRLGITYLLNKNVSFYALHDESFLSQRGAIFGGGRLPALTGSNDEIGLKASLLNNQLLINASRYDIKKNNVGTTDQLHDGFYLKTGQIRSRGFDFDIMGKLNKNLSITANYSFCDAKITKDTDSTIVGLQNAGTTRNIANVWLKYQISNGIFKGLSFGGGAQYTGERSGVWPGWNSDEGNKFLPAYTLYDASIGYQTDRFSISLNIYNLANIKYASNGWWYPEFKEWIFDMGTPRNFRIQTNIRF
jgi:iron complex outermembrane recepter protein